MKFLAGGERYVAASCYKPPREGGEDFASELDDYLSVLAQTDVDRLILAGDFNLDCHSAEFQPLEAVTRLYSLKLHTTGKTHRQRTIDLLFSGPKIFNESQCVLQAPLEKEHAVLCATFQISKSLSVPVLAPVARPCFSKADWTSVRRELANLGLLAAAVNPGTVEEAWLHWSSIVRHLIKSFIPHRKPRKGQRGQPSWMTGRIRQLLRDKNSAWQSWNADRGNASLYAAYSRVRRLCKKEILLA